MKMYAEDGWKNIPIQLQKYQTFQKRLRGLMFRLEPIQYEGIWLEPCNSIHMFFMFFSIDVVFLNKRKEIVAVKEDVKPWTMIFPIKNAHSTIELPVGTIEKYNLKVGNVIEI